MSTAIMERYKDSSLDNFRCSDKYQENMIKYFRDCVKNGFSDNIVLTGKVGTGKTHLCYAIINALEEKNQTYKWYSSNKVYYTTVTEMIGFIRALWGKNSDKYDHDAVNRLKNIPLLIIDEIGVQYGTESERIELFDIFNHRYNSCLPTMVVSNLDRDKIEHTLGAVS